MREALTTLEDVLAFIAEVDSRPVMVADPAATSVHVGVEGDDLSRGWFFFTLLV